MPPEDRRSAAVLEQMLRDELGHAQMAEDQGGMALPAPLRAAMHAVSRVMTEGAARI